MQAGIAEAGNSVERDELLPVAAVRGATSVLSDLATIASGRIAAAVLSLVTALITTRMLGPAGYGTVALVGVVSTLIFTASTAWTGISVRRYGRNELECREDMVRLTWNRAFIGAPLIATSVALIVALKAFGAVSSVMSWDLVVIAVATGLVNIIVDHWCCLLETSGKMRISAAGQVVSQAAYVVVLVILFMLGMRASSQGVLLLALGSTMLLALGAAPFVWRVGVVPPTIDRALLRKMLWLSTPMIGLMASQYVFGSVDIIVLRMFRSQADVGVYAVAYQGYTVLSAAAVTATSVLVPLFVSLQGAGRRSVIRRYFKDGVPQGLFLISIVCGVAVTPVPLLVPVVFGQRFAAAAAPMSVLLVGLACLFASYLTAPILTLHEQTRRTAVINAIATAINVAADFLLLGVAHMGIVAPAIATSVALAFVFVAFYLSARRALELETRPDPALIAPLIGGLIPALMLQGIPGMITGLVGVLVASTVILTWRPPFTRADAELIVKLDMPDLVKRVAVWTILRVS